ncbi:hypothetical protein GF337_19170 [candidate division KSB1 bacterium]|nr:hypothetical protein [candidate division KSB1 bacterium]
MDAAKWKTVASDWLQGVSLASIRMIGAKQVKTMFRGMSLVFVNTMTRRVEEETGQKFMDPTDTLVESVEKLKQAEVAADFCTNGDVEINQESDDKLQVTLHNCMYGDFCNEAFARMLSSGEFNEKSIPCLRLSNYSAAATLMAKIRSPYHLIQFAPGAVCKGIVGK